MKKAFPLILLVFLLAACSPGGSSLSASPVGPSGSPSPSSASAQTETTAIPIIQPTSTPTPHPLLQVQAESLSGQKLAFWHPWTGETAQAIESIVREFNNTNVWGIQVYTFTAGGNGALVERFEDSLTAGSLPNVVVLTSEQMLFWQEEMDLFTDLNVYIHDTQWGLTGKEQAEIPLSYWTQDAISDQQVGLPALRDMRLLFYNQSWGKELGFFTSPQGFDAFRSQVCAAAEIRADIDQTGGWIVDTHPQTTLSWILTAQPKNLFEDQTSQYHFNSPQIAALFTDLRALLDDGCAWNSRLPDPYEYFANRQALVYAGSLPDVITQKQWMEKQQNPDNWVILPFPVEDDKPVVLVSGYTYAIRQTNPQEQLAAWLFLRWLVLPRHQAQLTTASGLLPVSTSAFEMLTDFRQTYPQWETALGWIPIAASPPHTGSWAVVQNILEDAAWQTYQSFLAPEDIPTILEQLDQLIPEVLSIQNGSHTP